jgi:hypothetical protein
LLKYESDWSAVNRVEHGDSIREVIDVFQGDTATKEVPPDSGKTLEDVLMTV